MATYTFRFIKQLTHLATSRHMPTAYCEVRREAPTSQTLEEKVAMFTDVKREARERLGDCFYLGYSRAQS